jgi:hypothetical protein
MQEELKYACVYWSEDDVFEEADTLGVEMNKEEAEVFLREHESEIKDAMIKAGWHEIRDGLSKMIP